MMTTTCSICSAKMRVERTCRVCDRPVCSKCSRRVLGQVDVCHGCIPPDYSGRSSRDSYAAGTSMQARRYFQLMREKDRRIAAAALAARPMGERTVTTS